MITPLLKEPFTPVRGPGEFLVFGAPAIGDAEVAEVTASLRSGWLGTGPKVARFEREFAAYRSAEHAVAVNSCTAALHLSMLGAGIEPGDEVITTPLTFCATINAIIHAGGIPVLADVESSTMNIDPAAVNAAITPRTRAIVPVHFAGRPCRMDDLLDIAERHGLRLIEDCAHAVETEHRGAPVGTFGDFGCFSFYVTKNVTTGEGGMILAQRAEDAARLKTLALHGLSADAWKRFNDDGYRHYYIMAPGFKYNMMDLQAAIGLHQLQRVEANWHRRRQIWRRYQEEFEDLPFHRPAEPAPGSRHAFHLYTVLVEREACGLSRDEFVATLTRHGIGVGVHYLAAPEHPYYRQQFGWQPPDVPRATRIGRSTVSLPLSAKLSDRDVTDVIRAVRLTLARR